MIISLDRRRKLFRRKPLKHDRFGLCHMTPTVAIKPRRLPRRKTQALTVCIAAIAASSRAIVLVADRMVSQMRGGQTVLKAESGVRKIRELPEGWVALRTAPERC